MHKNKKPKQLMTENLLVKHYAGSISYGTNLPTSDVDFRGIFCGDPINVRTPFYTIRECEDSTEEDTKFYELTHFMKLCIDCNPNIIETLWVDDSDITYRTPAYDLLRENRKQLLSSKIAFTTSGYAIAQLKRIKGHNKWINNPQTVEPPRQIDFITFVQNFTTGKKFNINMEEYRDGYRLIPYGHRIYGIVKLANSKTYSDDYTLNTTLSEDDNNNEELQYARKHPLFIIKFNKEEYDQAKEKHKNYWVWKKNRNKARSELEEHFGYDCYSDDTEFLTNNGWKKFDDVQDGEMIATFNQFTHKIEYQTPIERIDSLFTGNMYHFTGHHTDTLVTSNHHMFIRNYSRTTEEVGPWEFARAAELPETFDTLRHISPKRNRQLMHKSFNQDILTKYTLLDYLRILGWFISDGTLSFYENNKPKDLRISQSKPQSKLTQTLNKQRNTGKITCRHYICEANGISNHHENVWVFDRQTAEFAYNDCGHGSKYKRLPEWSFYLTKREMTTLLVALLQGDGSQRNHKHYTYGYHTTNKLLADDIQRLSVLCGYETSLYESKTNNMFEVYINMRPAQHKRTARARVKKISVTNSRIVCFMVPNLTLITRRNGQVSFHGNTKHAMHLVRLLRMGIEALRDEEIIVKRPDADELLDIRNGSWSYDEIVKYAEEMDNQVRKIWYKKTNLPKYPNIEFAANLLMEVQDLVWTKKQ